VAMLDLEAEATSIGSAGTSGLIFVGLLATDAEGNPRRGLENADGEGFECRRAFLTQDPYNFGPMTVTEAVGTELPGVYVLTVVPPFNDPWKKGNYVLFIEVQSGPDEGKALTSVQVR
jgi:hypothetical protein